MLTTWYFEDRLLVAAVALQWQRKKQSVNLKSALPRLVTTIRLTDGPENESTQKEASGNVSELRLKVVFGKQQEPRKSSQ